MAREKLSPKGRITSPKNIRATKLKGILYEKGRRAVTIEEMNMAIVKRMGRKQ